MWTFIKKNNINEFLEQYPSLKDYIHNLTLYETSDAIFVPRLFANNYQSDCLEIFSGKKQISQPVDIIFTGKLRDKQKVAVKQLLSFYEKNQALFGIGKMFPAFGKTVVAVYIASILKMKVCIILDNKELLNQWTDSFTKFSNIKEEDIGFIRQNKFEIEKPVVIAMTQSLLSKIKRNFKETFHEIDNARFGFIVYDEVHSTSSSENFAKVSILFRTRNILGLSATPFQTGLAEILMRNTIGETIYETKDYDLKPKYYFVYYDSQIADLASGWKKQKTKEDITIKERIGRVTDFIKKKTLYNKFLTSSLSYLSIIASYTKKLLEKDYRIIIMCMTVEQIKSISERLTENNIEHRRFYGSETEIDKENDKVLVVTYSYCSKGFDMVSLSALIIACPLSGKKSIIQIIGRILRKSETKNKPLVIDLIDTGFPGIFIDEVKRKKKIIPEEFDCEIYDYKEEKFL